ncbi:MAG TPA: metallophosphoesterase [Patescibacteria group bacterium]|nr:metallophosphoesterase [Patescibacteria group bacterium]
MRLSFFAVGIPLLLILIDLYVLKSWSGFVKRRSWRKAWSVVPYILSVMMLAILIFANWSRRSGGELTRWNWALAAVAYIWFVPKLPIVIVLLLKDFFVFVKKWTIFKDRNSIKNSKQTILRNKETAHEKDLKTAQEPELESRRKFVQTLGWGFAAVPFVVAADGLLRTTRDFTTYNVNVPIPNLPRALDGVRIVQLSDIHAGSFFSHEPLQEIRRIVSNLRPDMIVITGDFVNFSPKELNVIYSELERFKAPLGVWGSIGNHDHYNTPPEHALLKRGLNQAGINLLVNQNHVFNIDGAKLQLAGTDNTGLGQNFADINAALSGLTAGEPTILLAHDPTFWDIAIKGKQPIDLMLSGHTHGGQVGMNFFGKEVSVAQFVYKQWAGLYTERDQHLYVNRGIGIVGPPFRIGIPPEITHFTLRRAASLA